jgi:hypothetical protein
MTGFKSKREMRKQLFAEMALATVIGVALAAALVYGWAL